MSGKRIDLRDIMLEAAADVQSLWMDMDKEIAIPEAMTAAIEEWSKLSAEQKDQFKNEKPEAYQALMAAMKGE